MSHDAYREQVLDLAYGELSPREARVLERHLEGCAECRAELGRIRSTRAAMSALTPEPAPEKGEAVLLAAAREAVRERARPRRILPPWLWAGSIAAVALVAVGAVSYRILAMRPGPLQREDGDAILGSGPYATAPAPPPPASEPADRAAPPAASGAPEQKALAEQPGRVERSDAARRKAAPKERSGGDEGRGLAARDEAREERFAEPARPAAPAAEPSPPTYAPPAERRAMTKKPAAPEPLADRAAPAEPLEPPAVAQGAAPFAGGGRAEAPQGEAKVARAERPAPVPPSAAPAPSRSRAAAPAAARPSAQPEQRAPERSSAADAEEAVARYGQLRAEGALRGEVVTFQDCPGEAWRKVETGPGGRVVKYVRHGERQGVPFEAELFYGADGALRVVRYREDGGQWREVRVPAGGEGVSGAVPPDVMQPRRAEDARAEGAPRCGVVP